MSNNTNDLQQVLEDMKSVNIKAKMFLEKTSKKIAELDLQYAKMLIKDDINTLKIAKKILNYKKD